MAGAFYNLEHWSDTDMIEIRNLSKTFGTVQAVKDVTLTISKGEIFGILGENGAGKTTTLRMMATMLKPTEGTVIVNGIDIREKPDQARSCMGILFGGESGLYDRLSVAENIRYFAELNGMDRASAQKRIDYLVEVFDMKEYINRRAGKLSKGMRQKAAFSRSIVHDPEILLLDEPGAGLDVSAMNEMQIFIKMQKELGKTIILSSHTMDEVEKLCDRIGIIHNGVLVEQGTLKEIKTKYGSEKIEEIFIRLVGERQ